MENEVFLALGRLEGKVDQLINGMNAVNQRMDKLENKHQEEVSSLSTRVSRLERREAMLMGGGFVISAIVSFAVTLLKGLI